MYDRKLIVLAGILIVITSILLLSLWNIPKAAAADTANEMTLGISPSAIIDRSQTQGKTFSLNVAAINITSLHGITVQLIYDPNIIGCTSVETGSFWSTYGNTSISSSIDNSIGTTYASVNFTLPQLTANGNGTLITLDFKVNSTGETKITLQNVHVYEASGAQLAFEQIDGYFNNKLILDFAMPLVLFAVTLSSTLLFDKVEAKLKTITEDREFRVQDAALLVGLMSVMIYLVVFVRQITLILMALFLFAYCMLLFMFTYIFSKKRWYIAILPPAVFVLLYAFFRDTSIWTFYLVNLYGLLFAILITLYLAGLFAWKTTAVFGVLITAMDIVLVLVTGTMVQAAQAARGLSLPVLVSVPLIPLIIVNNGPPLMLSLGLGDFFFAGLLAIQTKKKYGTRFAILTMIGMSISFFIFEVFLLNYIHGAFPGTLMIICGWAPFVIAKWLSSRQKTNLKPVSKPEEIGKESTEETKQ